MALQSEPENSCVYIDSAISDLNKVRSIAEELRSMLHEKAEALEEAEARITELEGDVDRLEQDCKYYESQPCEECEERKGDVS